jgi:hypothetical protein
MHKPWGARVHPPPARTARKIGRDFWVPATYDRGVTKLLEHALDTVRALPPDLQDELARLLLQVAGEEQPVIQLTAEERADLAEADAEIARGEFATDKQIRSILAKRTL